MDTKRLRELLEAATPRPWINENKYGVFVADELGRLKGTICWTALNKPTRTPENEANAALIVAAVNTLPELLAEREKLLELVSRMKTAVQWQKGIAPLVVANWADELLAALGEGRQVG